MDVSDAIAETSNNAAGGGAPVRLFHCTVNEAHKFWSIQVRDTVHTVRFGRIGRTGQTCLKTFPTPQQATKAAERLIAEKRGKGYVEVSTENAAAVSPRGRADRRRQSLWQQLCLPFEVPVEPGKKSAITAITAFTTQYGAAAAGE
jgi:predicted DNA-binding WGR domain protein